MKIIWDGRASFYPQIGYDKDADFMVRFQAYLDQEGIPFRDGSESSSDDDESSSDNGSSSDCSGIIIEEIANNPPLYDRLDHYHPMFKADAQVNMLGSMMMRQNGEMMLNMMPSRLRGGMKTPSEEIVEQALLNIISNRRANDSVKHALRSNFLIDARISGLRGAPSREIIVPGNLPLAVLHDRVLCPVFGWTRGFHDYRFCLPPSDYEYGPPKNPSYDLLFGAESDLACTAFNNHGYYGTLRKSPHSGAKSVNDTQVCLADLLQAQDHEIHHVLGGPGWKTVIKVKGIVAKQGSNDFLFGKVVSGSGPNLPNNCVIEISFGDYYEIDSNGPQGFALAHEMIKRSKADTEKNGWMAEYVTRQTSCSSSKFDLDLPFNINAAKDALERASHGDTTPNPEYSHHWMSMLLGNIARRNGKHNERSPDPSWSLRLLWNHCRSFQGKLIDVFSLQKCTILRTRVPSEGLELSQEVVYQEEESC
jgi:hypothetical protein